MTFSFQQSEMNEYRDVEPTNDTNAQDEVNLHRIFMRRSLTFMAFINVGEYLKLR